MEIICRETKDMDSVEIIKSQHCPYLPQDPMFEILTRVSLETLERCRLVSKEWNHVTYEPSFMKLYCKRNGILSGFFIQCLGLKLYTAFASQGNPFQDRSLSLDMLPVLAIVRAVSNQGLVYCESLRSRFHYVCKPTTGEWVKIPNPKTRFTTYRNAMVVLHSRPLHYKVVRLSEPKDASRGCTIICEIFDSEKGAWKRLENIKSSGFVLLSEAPPVFASGAFHWFTFSQQIFAFDINSEKWELIDLPENFTDETTFYLKKALVQYEGKLALLRYAMDVDKVEIWVMENYSRRTWKLAREIVNSAYEDTIVHLYRSDVAVVINYKDLVWYDLNNGTSTTTKGSHIFFSRNYLLTNNI
ncbi:F-box domain - like 10 [Theobroma cacao]|nr:F-box domain - like 10 [Theobroma cacao]